jgi:hypothetical protein
MLPDATSRPSAPALLVIQPGSPFTLLDRFNLQVQTSFSPSAFAFPAAEASLTLAHPPSHYPHDWRVGPGGLGRNYGADLARHTTGGLTHFSTAAILREDPRYYPSASANPARRLVHSLAFTLLDRSNSGRRTIAFSNLAGSAAAGFVGMAIYPDGFNDTAHACQQAAFEMSAFAAHNVLAEFSPEVTRMLHKLHFPDRAVAQLTVTDRNPLPSQPQELP